jgi:polygalacturonase
MWARGRRARPRAAAVKAMLVVTKPLLPVTFAVLLLTVHTGATRATSVASPIVRIHPRVRALIEQLERGRGRPPPAAAAEQQECLVTDTRFGARCDNATNDTLALQRALDLCGSVALPDGRTCLTHALHLRNATQLRIPNNAVLKAFPNASAWDPTRLYLVAVRNLRDATVYGGGTLDGSGNTWWVTPKGPRPHLFFTGMFHNVTFRDLQLINSGRGMLGLGAPCTDIAIDNVSLVEPAIGNSDGIDVSCDGFLVQNSLVQNGDDSICTMHLRFMTGILPRMD